jgi:hypothetical protein
VNDLLSLGPWPKGIVQTISTGFRPLDGLEDATNVTIDPLGSVASARLPAAVAVPGLNVYSMWEHNGVVYGSSSNGLFTLVGTDLVTHTTDLGPATFTVVGDRVVAAVDMGLLYLSTSGIEALTAAAIDEDVEFPVGDMPGGQCVQYWNGRVVVARGSRVLFSEPFRYGTHDPLTGYIEMDSYVEWIAALPTGVFVAMEGRIIFLGGRGPQDLTVKECGSSPWLGPQAFVVLDGSEFDESVSKDAEGVVAFLTRRGFAVGTPDGAISTPQAKNILDIGIGRCSISYDGGFLYANLLEHQP